MSDPYAPPTAESPQPHIGTDEPWTVSAGELWVRDGANLPEVCLLGSPRDEPGLRKTIPLTWQPRWLQPLVASPVMLWILSKQAGFLPDLDVLAMLAMVALFLLLARRTTKKARLHAFVGKRRGRKKLLRLCASLGAVCAVVVAMQVLIRPFGQNPTSPFPIWLGMAVGGMAGALISVHSNVRARVWRDGWFAVTGVHPAAISRLAEIQSRASLR